MSSINTSGIKPIADHIIVLLSKKKKLTEGGIILPDNSDSQREHLGQVKTTLVAIGEDAFLNMKDAPKIGQKVITTRYPGLLITADLGVVDDESEYRLCRDTEVLGILE
jgi:co-chaperonin GroES (HSP10)|tara:strand:- start:132 stop:458 length:327 start_codon:yes stop_codon:yes gene_type:complete